MTGKYSDTTNGLWHVGKLITGHLWVLEDSVPAYISIT